jgi:hypothetical protein
MNQIFDPDDNTILQDIPLSYCVPSRYQCRLFVEQEKLEDLVELYRQWAQDSSVILPDPPVVNFRGWDHRLEILGGERRVTAAFKAGLKSLPMRVEHKSGDEAYRYILASNQRVNLTNAETSFRIAEMRSLGFTDEEIFSAVGRVSLDRYLLVGQYLRRDLFTDTPKLCDPPITLWYEAALKGLDHFEHCFQAWDAGLWDLQTCRKEFRQNQPRLDNCAKGLRITVSQDGRVLNIKGKLDLDMLTEEEIYGIYNAFHSALIGRINYLFLQHDFGIKESLLFNPDTVNPNPNPFYQYYIGVDPASSSTTDVSSTWTTTVNYTPLI